MRKKLILLAAASLLAGSLAGCGSTTAVLSEMNTDKYVALGEYKGLEASAPEPSVTDGDVENKIHRALLDNKEVKGTEVTDRAVQEGDTVIIDYTGTMDGEVFEGGSAEDYSLTIGSGQFIPGFEDGLIGAASGETREVKVTFPDPYANNPAYSGKPAVFTVTVNKITVVTLTDENAALLDPGCAGAEEYRQKVYDSMKQSAQLEYDNAIETSLVKQVSASSEFKSEPPKKMVDQYLEQIRKNLQSMADYNNMTFAQVLTAIYGIPEEQFEENARPGAVESAQESIMLQAIANKENLNPTDEELVQMLEQEAKEKGFESAEKYKEAINEENYRDYVMVRRVIDFIKENATISAVKEDAGNAAE